MEIKLNVYFLIQIVQLIFVTKFIVIYENIFSFINQFIYIFQILTLKDTIYILRFEIYIFIKDII